MQLAFFSATFRGIEKKITALLPPHVSVAKILLKNDEVSTRAPRGGAAEKQWEEGGRGGWVLPGWLVHRLTDWTLPPQPPPGDGG